MKLLVIFLLGGIGGLTRALFDPLGLYGTMTVNLAGMLLAGVMTGLIRADSSRLKPLELGFFVGFLGSLTTFGTMMTDALNLAQHHAVAALLYLVSSILGGILLYIGSQHIVAQWINDDRSLVHDPD